MLSEYCQNRIRSFVTDAIRLEQVQKVYDNFETVSENLYSKLPSGDYGRGDVSRALAKSLVEQRGLPTSPGGRLLLRLLDQGYSPALLLRGHAPAIGAEGQHCAQCGALAWRVQLLFFCQEHDQETLAASEGRTLGPRP